MATLTGELISETYDSLLKVTDNNTITGIKKRITDGFGNDIPLLLSSTDIEIDGTLILSSLTDLAPASKFLSLKADNSVGFRTSSELLSDIGGASSASISGTTGRLSKFTSSGAVGNSILNEIGNAIHLTDGTSSYASFGINNPGIDNDAYIGSTINNDFLIKVNNTEALRIDTAFRLKIANIQNALGDTDKFLVSEDGVVKYRTGTELRSDIGAGVGSVTSVGLTMPVAFSVANSPITSAGTLEVTAVGTASQYIRGDGQLATLPTGAGGGSAVNYYLNGSVASGVAGYQQMDNTAIIGTGTDFTLVGNGLIAQFLTDAGNPNRLLIPGGAWNLEMFFQVSSSGGNAKFYVDLFKYDGTTFTSIASGITTPEEITGGTSIDLYLTSLGIPETALLITDRLAIQVYIVDNSGGRTVTLHTEDNTLCQVTTTFAGGISALNGLTANTQYFAVGTSGTDFNISSTLDTHTFNLPTASTTKRGALSASDWNTFNNKQPAGNYVTLDTNQTIAGEKTFTAGNIFIDSRSYFAEDNGQSGQAGYTQMITLADSFSFINGATTKAAQFIYGGGVRSYTLPSANGTLALTSALTAYVPYTGATGAVNLGAYDLTVNTLTVGRGGGAILSNTAFGINALFTNTTGQLNTAIGYNSGYLTNAGASNQTSQTSVYIGADTRASANGNSNEIVIGCNGRGGGSNSATLGNSSIATTNLKGKVGIGYTTNPSLYDLDVNGTGRFAGDLLISKNNTTDTILKVQNGTNFYASVFQLVSNNDGGAAYSSISLATNGGTTHWQIGGGGAAANTLPFYTGGVKRLEIASTGAATFSSSVTVKGDGTTSALYSNNNNDSGAQYYQDFGNGAGFVAGRILRGNGASGYEANGLNIDNFAGMQIKLNALGGSGGNFNLLGGNVGIGTTTPLTKLHLEGDSSSTSDETVLTLKGNGENGKRIDFRNVFGSLARITGTKLASGSSADEGILTFETATNSVLSEKMRITSGGNVGIGTTTPGEKLHISSPSGNVISLVETASGSFAQYQLKSGATNSWVFGTQNDYLSNSLVFRNVSDRMVITTGGNVGIGTTTPSYQLQLSTDSAAKPTSALWTIASDERIKENISPYTKGLDVLMSINPVTYDYNGLGGFKKGKGGVGIIAQEIMNILPDSVNSVKGKLKETDKEEIDILNFNGHELTYVLINAIKELNAKIIQLENK